MSCDAPRAACTLVAALCLLVIGILAGTQGWDPTCQGSFKCSALEVSSASLEHYVNASVAGGGRPGAWLGQDWVSCRYGHIEAGDGTCARSCEGGVRRATCRCQSADEAMESTRDGAELSLYVSLSIVALGVMTASALCLCSFRVLGLVGRLSDEQPEANEDVEAGDEDAAEDEGTSPSPSVDDGLTCSQKCCDLTCRQKCCRVMKDGLLCCACFPCICFTTVLLWIVMLCCLKDGGSSNVRDLQARSRVEQVTRKHPLKFKTACALLCLAGLFLAALAVQDAARSKEGVSYERLDIFMSWAVFFSLAIMICVLLLSAAKDGPVLAALRAIVALLFMLPSIGLAGVVWSLVHLARPEGVYHACEVSHCIFNLC